MESAISRRNVMVGAVASATVHSLAGSQVEAARRVVHDVRIKAFKFAPDRLDVSVGDIIRWTNEDLAPHTATADDFGWDTHEIVNGANAEVLVTEEMEATYFCAHHPHMKGTLVI